MHYIIIILSVVLDQLSKAVAISYLKPVAEIHVIPNVFHLTYVENRGAAFGILYNQRIILLSLTVIVVSAIIVYLHKNHCKLNKSMLIALSLIAGGATGNFIDRFRFGYVVDFFDFRIWPVFNIADLTIVAGQIFLIYALFKYDSLIKERSA